jgi:hypothetical protein
MKLSQFYLNSCIETARGITNIALKNGTSIVKVNEIYNEFSRQLYTEDVAKSQNKVKAKEFAGYKPALEEKTLALTEWYFNFPKN